MKSLQPPFSSLLTKIVSTEKWGPAAQRKWEIIYLRLATFLGVMYGAMSIVCLLRLHGELWRASLYMFFSMTWFFVGFMRLRKLKISTQKPGPKEV